MPKSSSSGFSRIELVAALALLGTLLASFVPVYLRHLTTSRLTEAPETLAELHRGAAAYWAGRAGTFPRRRCLPPPAGPTPADPLPEPTPFIPSPHEAPTWNAIAPSLQGRPLRFSYAYIPEDSGCDLRPSPRHPFVRLRALGDLDGDGEHSTFERAAGLAEHGEDLVPIGPLLVRQRVE